MVIVQPIDKVLSAFSDAKKVPTRQGKRASYVARCPVHDDQHPSLSVDQLDDGTLLVLCRVCGREKTPDILRAVGLSEQDLFPREDEPPQRQAARVQRQVVATFDYRDERGEMLYQSVRLEPGKDGKKKDFTQRRPDGNGGWLYNLEGVPRVLYRLPELLDSHPEATVWIPEGERKVDALRGLGLVSVCNVGGAGKWRPEYSAHLRGRQVVLLPDNDGPGRDHVGRVAAALDGVAAGVVTLQLPGLPPKGDVLDWLAAGGTRQELERLADAARKPPAETLETIPWPKQPPEVAFYGLAGEVVKLIDPETESDPVAVLLQFLAAFGNACGRSAYFQVEARRHYANLYAVLVGKTAKGRKGTSWGWVESLFVDAVAPGWPARVQAGLSSGEGLIWAVRDPILKREPVKEKGRVTDYQEVEVDAGVSDKRLMVVEEEFSSVLRQAERDGNTLSVVVRQAWDSGRLRSLTKNSPARATDAHVSILGHITREELVRQLSQTDTANGFANRFLWVCVQRSKLLPDGGRELDLKTVQHDLMVALNLARTRGRLSRTPRAAALWRKEYPCLSRENPGMLGLVCNRAEAQVLRLSLIYALLDSAESIDLDHLRAALALWDYAERSCRWIFGEATGNKAADDLLDALRSSLDGLTLTEISEMVFQRHKSAREIKQILSYLVSHQLVLPGKAAAGGKPAERFRAANPVNPANPVGTTGLSERGGCESSSPNGQRAKEDSQHSQTGVVLSG